jgi:hypothetical protein
MRIEIQSGPSGTKLVIHLSEDEGRQLSAGVEHEARQWHQTLFGRICESGGLDQLRQLQDNLETSRIEQRDLEKQKAELLGERRLLLAQGANTEKVQAFEKKKLGPADDNIRHVAGRIFDLERLIAAQVAELASQISESQRDLQEEMYVIQQRQKMRLEKDILDAAGDSIKQLLRLNRVAQSRGFDFQRFLNRVASGDGPKLVADFMAKMQPDAEAVPVEAIS